MGGKGHTGGIRLRGYAAGGGGFGRNDTSPGERPSAVPRGVRGYPPTPLSPPARLAELSTTVSTPARAMLARVSLCAIIAVTDGLAD